MRLAQQLLLYTELLLLIPVVERDTDGVGHREDLARTEAYGAIRRDATQLLVDLHQRNPRAQGQRDQPAHRLGVRHRGATGLAEVDEDLERLATVVLGDVHEHRA